MESASWQARVADVWADAPDMTEDAVVAAIDALVAERHPDDAAAAFEAASARDYAGREADAEPLYRRALELGLAGDLADRARIQLGSTLRNLGSPADAIAVLSEVDPASPLADAARAFGVLALIDLGDPGLAARVALETLAPHLPAYAAAVARYTEALPYPDTDESPRSQHITE